MRHLILREAGGMGDVIRTFPVARALKERGPGARVECVCLAGYEGLVLLSGSVDAVHVVSERERRGRDEPPSPVRHAYLTRIGAFEPGTNLIDLYCPAYRHEVEKGGAVTLDRVELFSRAGGVEASTPRMDIPSREVARARERFARSLGRPTIIGLAPYASHAARSWLGAARLRELGALLRQAGAGIVMFHSWKWPRPGRDEGSPADAGALPALRLGWRELACAVAACDIMIAADTGPLHLAGALGVPTVGLFGCTSGEVVCRPYPAHSWLTSSEPPTGCRAPCYGRPSRGYSSDVCGRLGCEGLRGITPVDVAARALAVVERLRLISPRRHGGH
jgi:ADP-heptose:LPS heptosyltransferase